MPGHFIPAAGYPQTADTRTQGEIIRDLLDYVGGSGRPEMEARARRALAETVRTFNSMAWRFNRRSEDITLVASTSEYPLNTKMRDVWKVMVLDENDLLAGDIFFMEYPDFLRYDGDTSTGVEYPDRYTLFNTYFTGEIRLLPRIGSTVSTQFPKVRVFYHIRIALPGSDEGRLAVPPEMETAIVRQAAALLVARSRSFEEATRARADANEATFAAQREWRDWTDFNQAMR